MCYIDRQYGLRRQCYDVDGRRRKELAAAGESLTFCCRASREQRSTYPSDALVFNTTGSVPSRSDRYSVLLVHRVL